MSVSFLVTNGIQQVGILSAVLFNLYMDDLNEYKTACMLGESQLTYQLI